MGKFLIFIVVVYFVYDFFLGPCPVCKDNLYEHINKTCDCPCHLKNQRE